MSKLFLSMKLRQLKAKKMNLFLFVLRQGFARKINRSWDSLCGAGWTWIHILPMSASQCTGHRVFSIKMVASARQIHFSVFRCVFALILVDLGGFKPVWSDNCSLFQFSIYLGGIGGSQWFFFLVLGKTVDY